MSEIEEETHWSSKGGVKNLTFEALTPKPKAQGWLCMLKECNGAKMNLLPVSKDVSPEFWICTKCKRQITIQERDQVFSAICNTIKDEYILHLFEYDKQNNSWEIKSEEWLGESRIGAKRKEIKSEERDQILDTLLSTIEDTLSIQFGSTIKDYFQES